MAEPLVARTGAVSIVPPALSGSDPAVAPVAPTVDLNNPQLRRFKDAIIHVESRGNPNAVSPQGAMGSPQITEDTFNTHKKPGELFTNDADRVAAAERKIDHDYIKYNGNFAQVAGAYIGGNGAILPDGTIKDNVHDALGTSPLAYSKKVMARLGLTPEKDSGSYYTTLGQAGQDPASIKMEQAQKDNQPAHPFKDLATGVETFWKNDLPTDPILHAIYSNYTDRNKFDPEFIQTKDILDRVLGDVESKYHSYIADGANSEAEMMLRKSEVQDYMTREEKYQKAGFGAGLTRMAGGLITPMNFAVMGLAAIAPEIGVIPALGRFGKLLGSAAEGSLINAGMESLTYKNRPAGDISEVGYAALMGLALGGIGGALGHIPKKGEPYAEELLGIHTWTMDELHSLKASDYVAMKLSTEHTAHLNRTPEEQTTRTLDLTQEYHDIYHQRYSETVHGTGDFVAGITPNKPVKTTHSKEWDTPSIIKDEHGNEAVQLPPKQGFDALVNYTREHSPNKARVAWMDKMLEGIDTSRIKYAEGEFYLDGKKMGATTRAAVHTPWNSVGTKAGTDVEFLVRDKPHGQNPVARGSDKAFETGLNDHAFVHEIAHVAAVYKQRLFHRDKLGRLGTFDIGIHGDKRTFEAAKNLDLLHQYIKKLKLDTAYEHYGMNNAYEFLAEGLTNEKFQEFLKTIKLPDSMMSGNAFSTFVSHVMDLLGLDKTDKTAFHRLLELAEPLTDEGGINRAGALVSGAPPNGYRALPNSMAMRATVVAAEKANLPPVWAFGLSLENRLYKSSLPNAVHLLANKLFGTSVGYRDHAVAKLTVWDDHKMLGHGWNMKLRKGALIPFMQWMKENKIPMMGQDQAHASFFDKVWEYHHGWEGEYDPLIIKAAQAMEKNYAEVLKHINNPLHSVGGTKLGLTETEHVSLDGSKSIQGTLAEDPRYMPRIHDSNKWDSMVRQHGVETVRSFWAAAYMDARDPATTSLKDGEMFGKWFHKTMNTAKDQAANQHLNDMMRGQDRPALIESLKDVLNLDDAEAERFADQLTGQGRDVNGQLSGALKHRSNINEKFVGGVGTPIAGMTIKDFVKTDAFAITSSYNERMSGLVSLAKNMDIYRVSDIGKVIADAVHDDLGGIGKPKSGRNDDLTAAAKDLQFAFDRILGVPQVEGFSPWRKGAEMVRNFNVIRLMGGAVFNQAVETASLTGGVGYKAMLHAIPEMGGLFRDMRTGKAPNEILDHLENYMGGAGGEYVQRLDFAPHTSWSDHYGDTKSAKMLDKMDTWISKGASGVLNKTGMTGLMVQQKRNFALAFLNGLVDISHGIEHGGASYLTKDRLAHLGYSEKDFGELQAALRKYTKGKTEGVIVPEIKKFDIAGFAGDEPALHHQLMGALMRESDRVIQENDLAAMVPWMGTTLGQLGFQFQGFSLQAWNKQMMFSMHHRDASTVNTMFQGIFFGSLIYTARTYQQSIGMEEEDRQKFLTSRLTPQKILAVGWGRTGSSAMLPNILSTVLPNEYGGALFNGGRTTSDLSGMMANPTLGLANSLLTLGKKAVVNPLDKTKQFDKSDGNAISKLFPLNNVIGVNNVFNSINAHLPSSSTQTD